MKRKAFIPSNGICRKSRHIDASNCVFCLKTMLTRRAERNKARIENDNNKNDNDKDHGGSFGWELKLNLKLEHMVNKENGEKHFLVCCILCTVLWYVLRSKFFASIFINFV